MCAGWDRGDFVEQDEEGNRYKEIVVFKIVTLKQSILYVIEKVSINGRWLKKEIDESILNLKETGFKVHAGIADDHSANVNAFLHLLNAYDGYKKLYIIIQLIRN